jgi:hypothetical protein
MATATRPRTAQPKPKQPISSTGALTFPARTIDLNTLLWLVPPELPEHEIIETAAYHFYLDAIEQFVAYLRDQIEESEWEAEYKADAHSPLTWFVSTIAVARSLEEQSFPAEIIASAYEHVVDQLQRICCDKGVGVALVAFCDVEKVIAGVVLADKLKDFQRWRGTHR